MNKKNTATVTSMRPFFVLWSCQGLSLLGSQIVQFALVWWLARETGSATVLTTATMVALLPTVLLGPLAGALVDRFDRRWVMLVADAAVAVASLGLLALFAAGIARPAHVFAILFARAIGAAFHGPAMQASTSLMVPDEQLTRVQGLNQSLQAAVIILSAPLGAVALDLLPMAGVIAIDVITAIIAIAPLLVIAVPRPPASAEGAASSSVWRDVLAGFEYVRRRPGLLGIVVMASVINLAMVPAFSLLPLLVQQHFARDALDLGWMSSLFGGGALAGGVLLGAWGGFRRRMVTSLTAIVGLGLATVGLGLTPAGSFGVALAAMFCVGLFQPLANGPIHAVLQATVAPDVQGRVFTLLASASTAMAPIGLAIAGPVSDRIGISSWFTIGGGVCVVMGLSAFLLPAIVRIDDPVPESSPATAAV